MTATGDEARFGRRRGRRAERRPVAAQASGGSNPLAQGSPVIVVRDQEPAYGGEPRTGGTLRLVRPGADPSSFNPAAFAMDFQVAASYLDPLLRADPLTMEPTPWLAESWDVSADGTEITYALRGDVRWHDGTPLTAADVAFSFEVYRDDVVSAVPNFFASLAEVETDGENTVRVRLSGTDPTWLFNASTLPIFQRSQYSGYWDGQPTGQRTLDGFGWRDGIPVGTGPWRIDEWNRRGVTFSANRDHPLTPPNFDTLEISWANGRAERLDAWRSGSADLLWPIRADELDRIGERPARLYAADAASVMFAAFNFANPLSPIAGVFDDVRVRRALSMAIDRAGYARDVFAGFADAFAAGTVAQPWAHDAESRAPRRDPAGAVLLLNEAGWYDYNGDGFLERADGFPLAFTLIYPTNSRPELARVLARVQLDLEDAGVDLVLQGLAPDAFLQRWTTTRDYDLIAYAFDLFPGFTDVDLYGSRWDVRRNVLGWNPGGYANPAADAAIDAYLAAETIDAARAALTDLQLAVDDDLFGLWLGFPQDLVLVSADVLGFRPDKVWQTAGTPLLWREPFG